MLQLRRIMVRIRLVQGESTPSALSLLSRVLALRCDADPKFCLVAPQNEYMKNIVARKPFWRALSFWAFEMADSNIHWEYPDADID